MKDEGSLDGMEVWIMRVGWVAIAAGIVIGILQYFKNR